MKAKSRMESQMDRQHNLYLMAERMQEISTRGNQLVKEQTYHILEKGKRGKYEKENHKAVLTEKKGIAPRPAETRQRTPPRLI